MPIDAILAALVVGAIVVALRVATLLLLGDASEEWALLVASAVIALTTIMVSV